ncbi:hypothetical protein GCM10007937_12370 [Mesorhizobium albiziae]|nr:hypothetical protein GCM10007937_12370 [Mesorhizobium albiziae]
MAVAQKAQKQALDHSILADDRLADAFAEVQNIVACGHVASLQVHWDLKTVKDAPPGGWRAFWDAGASPSNSNACYCIDFSRDSTIWSMLKLAGRWLGG